MNKLYYAYSSDSCTKIFQEQYLCNEVELLEIQEVNPCTVQFLSLKNLSTCQKHNVRVNRPIIKHIENSNQWIFIIPDEENIKLHCHHQEEILKLSEELGYVLYSALGSFYIPSCIMVFVYIRIYFAAKARARRGIRKPPRRPALDAQTSFTNSPVATATKNGHNIIEASASVDRNSNNSPRDGERQIATIEAPPSATPISIPTVTCDLASDISTSDNANDPQDGQEQKDTLKVISAPAARSGNTLAACQFRGSTLSVNGELQQQAAALARARQPSMGIDTDMVSEFDPSSSDSGVVAQCTAVKPLKLRLCKPIFGRAKHAAAAKNRRTDGAGGKKSPKGGDGEVKAVVEHVVPRVQKPRDPEREKRRIARKKEKRATLILGLIMGSFIACWLPFFFMYILRLAYWIPPIAFSTAFWLGYMNSALNPVIYTIFNKDFRRAFRRILFK
ncbi:alpha-2B adrenergic receptor-like [Sitophilus oryzae]|uniref:Alpha-2B adrenergic receptor-like n=1 Tax=Sitophilus oryzae TaxID=7048 RepID=A0A6J2X8Y4_SITOR|nr:alpha-2B adrenergic receptor-like [Sitophilus oryzae]